MSARFQEEVSRCVRARFPDILMSTFIRRQICRQEILSSGTVDEGGTILLLGYAGKILAPANGFRLWLRFFPFRKKLCCLGQFEDKENLLVLLVAEKMLST